MQTPAIASAVVAFTVRLAEEDHYWLGEVTDPHLRAALGVVRQPLTAAHGGISLTFIRAGSARASCFCITVILTAPR